MRELIKPGLLWVARLGLSLSVVAWASSQWGFYLETHAGTYNFSCHNCEDHFGINVGQSSFSQWSAEADSMPNIEERHSIFNPEIQDARSKYYGLKLFVLVPGLILSAYPTSAGLNIRHWLIVTIFAAFYGLLKWVYRKRAGEVVGDE